MEDFLFLFKLKPVNKQSSFDKHKLYNFPEEKSFRMAIKFCDSVALFHLDLLDPELVPYPEM
ncbi:MAG: hypothetical protein A3E74_08570 [Omnitrophica bacterium RIFCSPHIGHO2_12_FULL_44_12]|nr:MAG: hypothetical protein A3B72_09560 [Omnitrophica bacterium RIFCSPHIGHO2_02_FULL_45_28]OGW89323.1 MAG: hypothetical protein A3E74_08570 [Omnitrophica bacterium RIFCSPHIGHO2_12_FULL_44_12]